MSISFIIYFHYVDLYGHVAQYGLQSKDKLKRMKLLKVNKYVHLDIAEAKIILDELNPVESTFNLYFNVS